MTIFLDRTLHDLYTLDEGDGMHGVVLVHEHPTMTEPLSTGPSLRRQFLHEALHPSTEARTDVSNMWARTTAQRYTFAAGKMDVVMFDVSPPYESNAPSECSPMPAVAHGDTASVFSQLPPAQQPYLHFVDRATDITLRPEARIAILAPWDPLSHLPHVLEPRKLYEIMSKRWLAVSGLPTPPSTVIDLDWSLHEQGGADWMCRARDLMLEAVRDRPIPFMAKTSIAAAGKGVFYVKSERDRQIAINELAEFLQRSLLHVNEFNRDLHPASLVIQELLPGEAQGLSLFVTKAGRMVFIACCTQLFDPAGRWKGATITYRRQDYFQLLYSATMEQVAHTLHQKGYHGPVGADVMIDSNSRQVIVDINPRLTGSYNLGLLQGHFTRRGLVEAAVLSRLFMYCPRDIFEQRFQQQFREGSLIVCAWAHDPQRECSCATVIFGAHDSVGLQLFIRSVEGFVAGLEQDERRDLKL